MRARIRLWLAVFTGGLLLGGATALPLEWETRLLVSLAGPGTWLGGQWPELASWLVLVSEGVVEVGRRFPFLAYGTDWLAFGHFVIALAFLGPWRDPIRNAWVVDFGLAACGLVIPFALIAGAVRGIPVFWRLVDCSFGVIGCVPLVICRRLIRRLERSGVIIGGVDEDEEYEELVRILEPFRHMRIETGPVSLSADYLRLVEEVESAPENGAGTDKTWVEKAQREFREYFARVAREN